MRRPKGIIFDLGDTILEEDRFNPLPGTSKILESAVNPHNFSPIDIQILADEIYQGLKISREELFIEFSEQNFHRLLYETLGITLNISYPEAERRFWSASTSFKPTQGVLEVLNLLKTININTGILSNTMFSGNVLKEELDKHNLMRYFNFIVASSDYGFRKPSPRIFNIAIKKIGFDQEDIWCVGDKLEYDIKGAIQSGLFPVWYNPKGHPNTLAYDCLEIRSWREFDEKLKGLA